ncbi:hypothetical protein PCK1_003081 [Pneumocystis canis]|nr:hypothetical protein PCK1_003081 [Pneumocystis canis]
MLGDSRTFWNLRTMSRFQRSESFSKSLELFVKTVETTCLYMTTDSVFSISGRGLRLETREDVNRLLKETGFLDVFNTVDATDAIDTQDLRESHASRVTREISEIHLNGNTFGVEACERMKEIIQEAEKTLKVFNASDIFTGRTAEEIPNALESLLSGVLACKQCDTIYLSDNAFGSTAAAPLIGFLSKHIPLKHLYLNNNGLGPNAGSKMAEALEALALLQHQQTPPVFLETIVCGRNRLESASMDAWSACFRAHSSIIHVKMPQNGIRPDGIRVLLETGLSSWAAMLAGAIEKALPNLELLELNDTDDAIERIRGIFEKRGKGILDDLADMEEPYESNHSFTSEESYQEVFDEIKENAKENTEELQHTENHKAESDKEKEVNPFIKRGLKGLAALLRHTHINKSS